MPDTTYNLQPNETTDAYNARINAYNASKPATTAAPTTPAIPMSQSYTTPVPTTPHTIALDSASTPAQPYQLPSYTAPTSDYYSKLLGSISTASDIVGNQSSDQIAGKTTQTAISTKILDAISKLSGRTTAQQTAETNAGLPDLNKNLTDVTSQIVALQNEAKAIPLKVQNDAEGRGTTVAGEAPIEAAQLRTNAIKALGLSSIAATLQGNIALAQQTADRAVAAEFDPLQSELDYLKSAYQMNADAMSEADKEQATLIQGKLQDRQDAIDQAKANRTTVINDANTAASNGAPATIVSQALGLDLAGATKLLAPYMQAKKALVSVGSGSSLYDPNTGKMVYGGGSGAGAGAKTFTQSQINNGAANAGIPIATFAGYDADTKNYFINNYATFAAQQKLIQSGERTAQEVANDIQNSTSLTEQTKQILLKSLGVNPASPAASQGGGFWNTVGSVLGGGANFARGLFGI